MRGRRLYVDTDPKRPTDICSTNAEHDAALERIAQIKSVLVAEDVPPSSIITGDSGNGGSLFINVDLPNDAEALALVEGVLTALSALFSDDELTVDLSVKNAATFARVPGTLNAKGDNIAERPHRLARLLEVPETLEVCAHDVLRRIAALAPEPVPKPPI